MSRRKPATPGATSNTLPTTPATYFVLETGPLGTGQCHGGYVDRHGGFARVSVEATSSSKDKTTYLLITHLTRLDKLPKARTMHAVIRSIWANSSFPTLAPTNSFTDALAQKYCVMDSAPPTSSQAVRTLHSMIFG